MSNSTPTRGLPGRRETARGNEGEPAEAGATGTMERRRFLAAAAAAAAAGGLDRSKALDDVTQFDDRS